MDYICEKKKDETDFSAVNVGWTLVGLKPVISFCEVTFTDLMFLL